MLEIRSLSKAYGDAAILQDVSFTVPRSQFLCLLGPSGCGKTTILRIAIGLLKATNGSIWVDDREITAPGQEISLVFQNYGLLPWRTVMGNVELGLEIRHLSKSKRREICQQYIERVGLAGSESRYPHQLSGGMQQRVALARALSKDAKVLLMDEPFAAVDMQTRERLQNELLSLWSSFRTTVVFVTHSVEEAIYLGDRVIVMGAHPGRIVLDISVDLERPRNDDTKTEARFEGVRQQIREALKYA